MIGKEELQLMKDISHEIWESYDDTYGYRTEKQTRNAEVSVEHPDNFWFFYGQFDVLNQHKMKKALLHKDTEKAHNLLEYIMSIERDSWMQ